MGAGSGISFDEYMRKKKDEKENSSTSENKSVGGSTGISFEDYVREKHYGSKADVSDVDEEYINSFMSDIVGFFNEDEYKNIGWSNASSTYDSKNSAKQDLDSRTAKVREWLSLNKSNYDDETYDSLLSTLDDFGTRSTSYVDSLKGLADYYGQWKTEDDYNRATRYLKLTDEAKGAEDFDDKSGYVSTKKDDWWSRLIGKEYDKTYEYINNVDGLRSKIERDSSNYQRDNPFSDGESTWKEKGYDLLEPDEISAYNYYYATGGKEKAEEYLNALQETLNYRKANKDFAGMQDNTALELLFGVEAGLDQFKSGIKNAFNFSDDYIPYSATQITSGMVREDLADNGPNVFGNSLGQVGYDLINTTTNMAPSILTSVAANAVVPGSGALIGSGLMGTSAAGNAYQEMLNLGYDKGQARTYSTLVGVSEAALQYALGGISQLGGKATGNIVSKVISGIDNGFARFAIDFGGKLASEGIEEGLQEIIDPLLQRAVLNADADIDWSQVAYSSLLGSLSAFGLEGIGTATSHINYNSAIKAEGNSIVESGGVESLVNLANEMAGVADTNVANNLSKRVDKVNGKNGVNTKAVGKLSEAVNDARSQINKADIVTALESKGISAEEAQGYADALVAMNEEYFSGKKNSLELGTNAQWKSITGNENAYAVLREVVTDMESNVNKRNTKYNYARQGINVAEDGTKSFTADKSKKVENEVLKPAYAKKAENLGAPVSEDGKAKVVSTDAEGVETTTDVTIKGIDRIEAKKVEGEDGKTTTEKAVYLKVADANGNESVVEMGEVEFASRKDAVLYEAFVAMDADPAHFDAYVKNFNEADYDVELGEAAVQYAVGFQHAYNYGWANLKNEMGADLYASKLTDTARNIAYTIGKETISKQTEAKQSALDTAVAERKASGKGKVRTQGKLHMEGVTTKKRTATQNAGVGLAKRITSLGIDVYIYESHQDADGNWVDDRGEIADNGFYRASDGSIHIDLNAGQLNASRGDSSLMAYTLSHELVHFMRDNAPAEFKEFADLLYKWYGKKGVSIVELVSNKMEELNVDWDTAYEEVVADSCESFLTDSNIADRIIELQETNKGLWETIRSKVLDFLKWMKSLFVDVDPNSTEGRFLRQYKGEIDHLYDAFYNTLASATETFQWAGSIADAKTNAETLATAGITVDENSGSAVMNSVRYAPKTQAEIDKVANALSESLGVSIEKAKSWVKSETSLASIILDPSNAMFLDYEADERYEAIKKSAEYPQGTVDFSNLCKKRREFTALLDKLQKEHPNRIITAAEMEKIRQVLIEENVEVACGLCYVEERRQLLGEIAQGFIDGYKNGTLKESIAKELDANDNYVPTIYDLITYDGYRALTTEHPAVAKAFQKFNNARGMQAGRLIEGIAEYKRDILKWSQKKVDFVNSVGGLRVFSFSDFEATHLIDLVQVIQDCAVKGVMIQAYTKVPAFANAVKDTNMKVNRSLIAKGTGIKYENGRMVLDLDPVEGININDKDFFDSTNSENIGNVLVGMSDEQIRLAMKTAFVDYIIPFHTGLKGDILKAKKIDHWDNYKNFQTDKEFHEEKVTYNKDGSVKSDGWVVAEKQINIYVDVIQAAEAEGKPIKNKVDFVNKFLAVAKEKGLKPRFWKFLDVDANGEYVYTEGYHKFLVDFKLFDQQGNILPQKPVVPVFDDALNARILNEYVEGKKAPVSRDKVYDRLENEVIKYSSRKPLAKKGRTVYNEFASVAMQWAKSNTTNIGDAKTIYDGRRGKYILIEASVDGYFEVAAGTYEEMRNLYERVHAEEDRSIHADLDEARFRPRPSMWDLQFSQDGRDDAGDVRPLGSQGLQTDTARGDEYLHGNNQGELVKKSSRKDSNRQKAPTFYSYMGVVVDGVKQDKLGAASVINLLKGRGVKDEEIKWSGIETWLEGKKSVTKAQLQEFIAGSQLQIAEDVFGRNKADNVKVKRSSLNTMNVYVDGEMVDTFTKGEDGNWYHKSEEDVPYFDKEEILDEYTRNYGNNTKWSEYKLDGGKNYREIVFQMPNSSYSNKMMRVHWGEDAKGVLAHTRIQDFNTAEGKMLFVEEIQSDWHNEGHKSGYDSSIAVSKKNSEVRFADGYYELFYNGENTHIGFDESYAKDMGIAQNQIHDRLIEDYKQGIEMSYAMRGKSLAQDAPFKDTYHEYVMKRLIRMAAEEGYDVIGWTPAQIQMERWSDEFAEGYRIEYDQDIPKFLRKYGKKWGATVGQSTINGDTEVWSMPITDSMKDSVLYEGQVMYQRRGNGTSNRSLLANALEGAVQNDTEARRLAEYKDKIELINAEEQELRETRERIAELSFAKGPKDTKTLKDLQDTATRLANRISTYDKQLLRLEATAPLKAVLEREKTALRKREKQKMAEAVAKYREKSAETLREVMQRNAESRKKNVEGRKRTAVRNKIKRVVTDLNGLLNRGTKERNVKTDMQETVGSALKLANVIFNDDISNEDIVLMGSTMATEEEQRLLDQYAQLIAKRDSSPYDEAMKAINKMSDLNRKLADLFKREKARFNKASVSEAVDELAKAYAGLKGSDKDYVNFAYSEEVHKRLLSLSDSLGGAVVKDMSLAQLEEVYDAYKMILHMVRESNSLFRMGKTEDLANKVTTVQEQILAYYKERKSDPREGAKKIADLLKGFAWNEMKPITAFETLGADAYTELFWDVIKAESEWARWMEESKAFLDEQRNKYGYKSWKMEDAHEFTLPDGKVFRLTLQDMMSIYAYSKREQAQEHMTVGGFQFDKNNAYKDKSGSKRVRLGDLYVADWTTISNIIGKLTDKQRGYVDAVQSYLTDLGQRGNEVSEILYGIGIFNETAYFPLMSARDYRSSIEEALNNTQTVASLKNTGMTKQTVPHASNPIILQGFDDVVAGHIDKMAKYCTHVLAIENISRVFDSVSADDNGGYVSTKAVIEKVFGESAKKYFDKYITDLNGGTLMNDTASPTMALFSKFKGTAVGASLSVIVQQPMAIIRAMDVIDLKHFVLGKTGKTETKHLYDEIKKYAPVATIKEMGGFDVGSSRTAREYLETRTDKGVKRVADGINDAAMWGAGKADELGWGIIWKAVKREVASTKGLKPGTAEFYEACGERFTEVIVRTQVYDSVNSRSGYMRSKSDLVKFATSFMGEPTTVVNQAYLAALKVSRANSKAEKRKAIRSLGRTMGVLVTSTLLTTVAKSFIYAMRDDDDDEAFLERWAKHTGENLGLWGDLNPLTLLPYARDIVSIFEGWDVERPDMSLITNLITSLKKLLEDDRKQDEDAENFTTIDEVLAVIGDTANLFGIPAKNVIRDSKAIINLFGDIFDDVKPTQMEDALVRGFKGEEQSDTDALYYAIINGDTGRADVIKKGYKDASAVESAIRTGLRENDPRIKEAAKARYDSDVDDYVRIVREIKAEGHFSQDTIVAAINAEINKLKPDKESESNSPAVVTVSDYYNLIVSGQTSTAESIKDELIAQKVAEGYTKKEAEKSVESGFVSQVKTAYMDGTIREAKAISLVDTYGGEDADGIKKVKEWNFETEIGYTWGQRDNAYRLGAISRSELISYIMDIEGKDMDKATNMVRVYEFRDEYPEYSDVSSEAIEKFYEPIEDYNYSPEDTGMNIAVYAEYALRAKECKGVDKDGDGKADSGTKKAEVMRVINSLPLTKKQKDALYYLNGWSKKTLYQAPWH